MIGEKRNLFSLSGFILAPCPSNPSSFDCGKKDLNEFFLEDQFRHEDELLTKTYVLIPGDGDISFPKALISFCNDAIRLDSFADDEKAFKKFRKDLPWIKRYSSLPAVKIARLGVHADYQKGGVGTLLLNMTKLLFLTHNRTGCRYLTVDAYQTKRATGFYLKSGFKFMRKEDSAEYEAKLNDPGFELEDSDKTWTLYYSLKWSEGITEAPTMVTVS